MTDRYFPTALNRIVIEIYEIGQPEPALQLVREKNIIGWGNMLEILADHYEVDEDKIEARDIYWGGRDHDEESAEVITLSARIVASFGRMISHSEALAIAMTEENGVSYVAEGAI